MRTIETMDFGQSLKKWLDRKGRSQSDLARYLEVSPVYVSRWTHNQTRPSYETLIMLSEYFGTTVDGLFQGPFGKGNRAKYAVGDCVYVASSGALGGMLRMYVQGIKCSEDKVTYVLGNKPKNAPYTVEYDEGEIIDAWEVAERTRK